MNLIQRIALISVLGLLMPSATPAQDSVLPTTEVPLTAVAASTTGQPEQAGTEQPSADALETAVALNYCRAAFHRIRKFPSPQILREEQEKILNNLNLSRLADPEVIQLYTSVLDEINQVGMAERERFMLHNSHGNSITRKMTWDIVALGTDVATGQMGNAVRTGANSWWDYRNMSYQRDSDLFKIEKTRMTSVVQKSSQFLDTFWKLAQKKKIPDRWLVRGDDLDALELAMREPDAETRLRILKRMETFMEAYPPYWYYVGRTQQELGRMPLALNTYGQLEELGRGHFRKDDMLATAMANRAAIEEFNGDPTAIASARKALSYSTDVWEANLICARVLQRQGDQLAAEDAILRNLDVALETTYSRVFLASLYIQGDEKAKLAKMLMNPEVVAGLPAPVLLRSAAMLGPEATPESVSRIVVASLQAVPRSQRGGDELLIRASNVWQLHIAQMRVYRDSVPLQPTQVLAREGFHDLRFGAIPGTVQAKGTDSQEGSTPSFMIEMTYPDKTVVKMALASYRPRSTGDVSLPFVATSPAPLKLTEVRVNEKQVALAIPEYPAESGPGPGAPVASPQPYSPGEHMVPGPGQPGRTETAKPVFDRFLPPPLRMDYTPLRPRAEAESDSVIE